MFNPAKARLTAALFAIGPALAFGQRTRPLFDFEITKVADGVYVALRPDPLRYFVEGNVTIIVNDRDVVVVDAGVAKSFTSTTITQDVYAFIFGQQGLMAGIGVQGNKISKLSK